MNIRRTKYYSNNNNNNVSFEIRFRCESLMKKPHIAVVVKFFSIFSLEYHVTTHWTSRVCTVFNGLRLILKNCLFYCANCALYVVRVVHVKIMNILCVYKLIVLRSIFFLARIKPHLLRATAAISTTSAASNTTETMPQKTLTG